MDRSLVVLTLLCASVSPLLPSCGEAPPVAKTAAPATSSAAPAPPKVAPTAPVDASASAPPDASTPEPSAARATILAEYAFTIVGHRVTVEHVVFERGGATHSISSNGCGLAIATVAMGTLAVSDGRNAETPIREGGWVDATNGDITMRSTKGERAEAVTLTEVAGCKPTIGSISTTAPSRTARKMPEGDATLLAWADYNVGGDVYGGRLTGTGSVSSHVHDDSWEILVVLDGGGKMDVDGKSSPLERGKIVGLQPKQRHGWTIEGARPLRAIQFFMPGGPELKFKPAQ